MRFVNAACFLISFFLFQSAFAFAAAPPSAADIVQAILANRDIPLSVDLSCESAPIDPRAKTIGDYFSQLVAALQDKRFKGLTMTIQSEKVEAKTEWKCEVMFTVDDAESPWRYGLSFRMSGAPLRADPKSFRCPGA